MIPVGVGRGLETAARRQGVLAAKAHESLFQQRCGRPQFLNPVAPLLPPEFLCFRA